MLLVLLAGVCLAVLQHGLQRQTIVYLLIATQTLGKGIGDDHLGVRAALRAAVAVTRAGIGQVAFVAVDVQQGTHHVGLAVGTEQGEQRRGGAVGIPDGVVVVVVGGVGPAGVLARLVHGHEHGVVEGGVEHAALRLGAGYLHLGQLLLPRLAQAGEAVVEAEAVEVAPRLLRADIADAHRHVDQRVRETEDWGLRRKGLVAAQAEVDGVGIAVVPAATHRAVTLHLAVAHHPHVCRHKLLALAQVGHGVLAQEVGCVDEKGSAKGRRIVEAIMGATLASGYLRADAVLVGGGVVAKLYGLFRPSLGFKIVH